MYDIIQYSLLSFLAGTCLGMLFKSYIHTKYLISKTAPNSSAMFINDKFYYLVPENEYNSKRTTSASEQ